MKDKCIAAITQAAGRSLTQEDIKGIEARIAKNQRRLAIEDRQAYLAMSDDQRIQAAATRSAQELNADAAKKRQRVALTIQKHDRIANYMAQQKVNRGFNTMESLKRVMAFVADGKSDFQSVETRGHAIHADYMRQLVDTFESIGSKAFGLLSNVEGTRAFMYELRNQDSRGIVDAETSTAAKAAAAEWKRVTETARKQFNAAGGQIGYLEDWGIPQSHSQPLVAKAGQAQWIKDIFPALDRKKYVNADGSLMPDAQVVDFLKEAWTTIATGGANKMEPGKSMGRGMLANANREERVIHFKDADASMKYSEKYSGKEPLGVMSSHIRGIAHDIAMVETFGPNPDLQFRYWLEKGSQEDKIADPTRTGKVDAQAENLQTIYDTLAGKTKPVANYAIAQGFDTLRTWMVATKLGSAAVTSITDNATMQLTAQVNNMSSFQLLRNQLSTANKLNTEELRLARRAGLSLQTLMGEMNRWGAESMFSNFSSKMSQLTMRLSGLNAMTEARRRAFGVTMYGSIGHAVENAQSIKDLGATDQKVFKTKGINDTDFAVWKAAKKQDWGNGNDTMLTPEAIYQVPDSALAAMGDPATLRREAALKLLGMVNEEINMAVIEPGVIDQARKNGYAPGTWKGEIVRSFFLFKSFPIASFMRHFVGRGIQSDMTAGGKAAYLASFIAGTTLLGAMAQQLNNLASGRDPQDQNNWKFWTQAFLKGGSLGLYGDFLFNTNTQYGNTPLAVFSGPVAGYAEDLIGLTQGNLVKMAQGQETNFGAEAIRFLKGNIPLQNLWYTKAVTDRLIFNNLQEMVNPGYLRRVESRAKRTYQQEYYYPMDQLTPERAPAIEKMAFQ